MPVAPCPVLTPAAPSSLFWPLPPSLPPCSEDVLWSALFVLAVVARDSSRNYIPHLLALVHAGVLPALEAALLAYRQTSDELVGGPNAGWVGVHCNCLVARHSLASLCFLQPRARSAAFASLGRAQSAVPAWSASPPPSATAAH